MIFLELSFCSVRDGKSISCWEPSSRVEFHAKSLTKRLVLSVDVARTIKKWRYDRFPPVENVVANPPEVARSDKLRCNRAMSRIFEDFLTVITRITKHFLISRSRIPMMLMEIMDAMCNGCGTRRCGPW